MNQKSYVVIASLLPLRH